MNRGHHQRYGCVSRLGLGIALLTLLTYGTWAGGANVAEAAFSRRSSGPHSAVTITAPANSSTIEGWVMFAAEVTLAVSWIDFYVDRNYLTSSPPFSMNWNSSAVTNGTHQLSVIAFDHYGRKLGSASVNVLVENDGKTTSVTTIPGLTGSPDSIAGADINLADYGNYSATGGNGAGYGLI